MLVIDETYHLTELPHGTPMTTPSTRPTTKPMPTITFIIHPQIQTTPQTKE